MVSKACQQRLMAPQVRSARSLLEVREQAFGGGDYAGRGRVRQRRYAEGRGGGGIQNAA